jgi:transposase InsO family protein
MISAFAHRAITIVDRADVDDTVPAGTGATAANPGAGTLLRPGAADPAFRSGGSAREYGYCDARGEICLAMRTQRLATADFADAYNAGAIVVTAAARQLIPEVSARTLRRWAAIYNDRGVAGLEPNYRKRSSTIASDPQLYNLVVAIIQRHPTHVRAPWIRRAIQARLGDDAAPSLRTIERFVDRFRREHPAMIARLANPDGWKAKFAVSVGDMSAGIVRVNQRWEIDGTPSDVICTDGRYHLNAVIDCRSRRIVAELSPTASAAASSSLLLKAFGRIGIPDLIITDWGKEYVNQRLTRAMVRLDIDFRMVARPYSGDLKPFVERGQQTVLHSFFATLPGFAGHSVADKQAIRARHAFGERRGERRNQVKLFNVRLTAADLQRLIDQYLDDQYAHDKHSGLLGRTPFEVFAEADAAGQVKRVESETLRLLLGESGEAVIGRAGIRVRGVSYWSHDLIPFIGQRIEWIILDDAGRIAVFDAQGGFLCIAENPDRAGLDRQALAIAAKAIEREHYARAIADTRKLIKQSRVGTLYQEILDHSSARAALARAAAPDTSNVVAMPYQAAAIPAARAAIDALMSPAAPVPHDEDTLAAGTAVLATLEERRERRALMLSDDELDELWIAIRRDGRALTLREQRFLSHFGNTAEQWADSYEMTDEFRALQRRMRRAS